MNLRTCFEFVYRAIFINLFQKHFLTFAANFQSNEKNTIYSYSFAIDGCYHAGPGQQETRLDEMALSLRGGNVRPFTWHELRRDRPARGRAAFRG